MKKMRKKTTAFLALLLALLMILSVPVSAMEEIDLPSDASAQESEDPLQDEESENAGSEDEAPEGAEGTDSGETEGETSDSNDSGDAENESADTGIDDPSQTDPEEEDPDMEDPEAVDTDKEGQETADPIEEDPGTAEPGEEQETAGPDINEPQNEIENPDEDELLDEEPVLEDISLSEDMIQGPATSLNSFANVTDAFSVHIMTPYGAVKSYYTGGIYYLFVPNDYALSALTMQYNGAVTAVSKGTLDTAGKTVSGAFSHGDTLSFTMSDGSKRSVKLMQSTVPSLSVWLNGYSLSDIHADKALKAAGTSVTLSDPSNAAFDLNVSGAAEFKGRGNSSWQFFDKKGYQIKFDKKTSMFGQGAAKKWVLVANANDGSLMKNKIAFELAASSSMAFVPSANYADLWINGEYQGLYLVTDKVEIGKTRLNLKDDKGVLIEMDNAFYQDEDIYFKSSVTGHIYTMKEAVNEDSQEGINCIKKRVEELEKKLHQKAAWSEIEALGDVQSFADFYLINDIMMNKEVLCTSFFYYMDGEADKIHMGPVWDFDTCMNNKGDSASANYLIYHGGTFNNTTDIFKCLSYYQEFVDLVKSLYNGHYKQDMQSVITKAEAWYNQIVVSADMNYIRWPVLGTTSVKGETYLSPYRANVDSILNWFRQRVQAYNPITKTSGSSAAIGGTGGSSVISVEEQLQHYKLVFDPEYYAAKYPDVKKAHGTNAAALLGHFLTNGVNEGRQAISNFSINYYKSRYADLRTAFGSNNISYVEHYISHGYKEGRAGSSTPTYIGNSIDNNSSGGTGTGTGTGTDPGSDTGSGTGSGTGTGTNTGTTSYLYNGRDYSPVFDADYYLNKYADLRAAYGTNKAKAFNHFLNNGIREGRRACENFDVKYYKNRYPDLQKAFGDNYTNYVHHYLDHGIKEGRKGSAEAAGGGSGSGSGSGDTGGSGDGSGSGSGDTGGSGDGNDSGSGSGDTGESGDSGNTGEGSGSGSSGSGSGSEDQQETLNLGSYALVFDADYYLNKYADLRAAYGSDKARAFNHFKKHGMSEGRQAIATFNPARYKARYADLQRAFGNNWPAYYQHYMNNGYREGRIAY